MEKRRIRINLMDVILLICLLAAAALLLYIFVFSEKKDTAGKTETATLTYVVEIVGLDTQYEGLAKNGMTVRDAVERGYLGTVSENPEYRETLRAALQEEEGIEVYEPIPGKSNMYLTITVEAIVTERGYLVGNTYVYVGKQLSLQLPELQCVGYCIHLDVMP